DHSHSHSPVSFTRAFAVGIALNAGFVLIEAFAPEPGERLDQHKACVERDADGERPREANRRMRMTMIVAVVEMHCDIVGCQSSVASGIGRQSTGNRVRVSGIIAEPYIRRA